MAISIHAPVKGATISSIAISNFCLYFNPRTREGCDFCRRLWLWCLSYFNPRTREGCDFIALGETFADDVISIHAPVKGATS